MYTLTISRSSLSKVLCKLFFFLLVFHWNFLERSRSYKGQSIQSQGKIKNKKVLLRECKRHTAHRVVSTPSVVLTGYPPSWPGWGVPGYPSGRVPPRQGTPQQGTPPWLDLAGYPPRCLPHGILGNVAKHYGIWVPPQVWTDKQSETITFPSYYIRRW